MDYVINGLGKLAGFMRGKSKSKTKADFPHFSVAPQ